LYEKYDNYKKSEYNHGRRSIIKNILIITKLQGNQEDKNMNNKIPKAHFGRKLAALVLPITIQK
jgi:hypothetical protein